MRVLTNHLVDADKHLVGEDTAEGNDHTDTDSHVLSVESVRAEHEDS